MSKRVVKDVIRLAAIVAVVAMIGADAWAQCTCTTTSCKAPPCIKKYYYPPGGSNYCRCLCTGSVVETAAAKISGKFCHAAGDVDCGELDLTLYGTENVTLPGADYPCPSPDDPTVLDPNCGILVAAVYQNPGGNVNCHIDTPFVQAGTLTTSGHFVCADSGKQSQTTKCLATLTVDLAEGAIPPPQNPNWQFQKSLFFKFKAVRTFCPGGYADDGTCCTTDGRVGGPGSTACGDGNTFGNGQPLTDLQLCVHPNSSSCDLSAQVAFNCESPKNLTCGGLTGITCPPPLPPLP